MFEGSPYSCFFLVGGVGFATWTRTPAGICCFQQNVVCWKTWAEREHCRQRRSDSWVKHEKDLIKDFWQKARNKWGQRILTGCLVLVWSSLLIYLYLFFSFQVFSSLQNSNLLAWGAKVGQASLSCYINCVRSIIVDGNCWIHDAHTWLIISRGDDTINTERLDFADKDIAVQNGETKLESGNISRAYVHRGGGRCIHEPFKMSNCEVCTRVTEQSSHQEDGGRISRVTWRRSTERDWDENRSSEDEFNKKFYQDTEQPKQPRPAKVPGNFRLWRAEALLTSTRETWFSIIFNFNFILNTWTK